MKTKFAWSAGLLASSLSVAAPAAPTGAPPAAPAATRQQIGTLPASDPAELAEFRRQADELYRLKEKAFAQGDAESILTQFYTADAISVGPEGKPLQGRDALRKSYQEVVKAFNVSVEPISAFVGGRAAWEWANFRVTPKDPKQKPFSFAILFVFAKDGNRWISGGDAYVVGEFPQADTVTGK